MKPKEQVLLQFKEYKITNVSLDIKSTDCENLEVELNTKAEFSTGKEFSIKFDLKIFNEEKTVNIDLTARAEFETAENITPEFKKSHFVTINAPAIIFPYLRAFISTITVNCGYDPIVLPPYNFAREKKEK